MPCLRYQSSPIGSSSAVDRRVLEKEQHVGDLPVLASALDVLLELARVPVGHQPRANGPNLVHGSFVHGSSVCHAAAACPAPAFARRSAATALAAANGVTARSRAAARIPSRLPSIPRASLRACDSE